ncbi:MAG: hypothetical protein B7Y97_03195 [Sphingomonas sp. 32-66-10]|nr:MAG: hypothetical protein B7Y97_03195 [Sphingomonas sp. 32-66-10]
MESVTEYPFLFSVEAVVGQVEGRRPSARHALLIFVTAADFEAAQRRAEGAATGAGWMMVQLKRGKPISGEPMGDEILDAALETSLQNGSAIVVYTDELTPDA